MPDRKKSAPKPAKIDQKAPEIHPRKVANHLIVSHVAFRYCSQKLV
jgi:hypothetical protein